MRIFVYGTLKEGFHNNELIKRHEGVLVQPGIPLPGYIMKSAGGFPVIFPVTIQNGERTPKVYGEIWEIPMLKSIDALADLDYLEAEGTMYYREHDKHLDAWFYVGVPAYWQGRDLPIIESGEWRTT